MKDNFGNIVVFGGDGYIRTGYNGFVRAVKGPGMANTAIFQYAMPCAYCGKPASFYTMALYELKTTGMNDGVYFSSNGLGSLVPQKLRMEVTAELQPICADCVWNVGGEQVMCVPLSLLRSVKEQTPEFKQELLKLCPPGTRAITLDDEVEK